jgi:ABC-type branched-subunit amino acid transport system substrate-binding protein
VGPEEAALLREEAAAVLGPDDTPLPPIVDFEALFIADAHEKAGLIAPQLAFNEVGGVQLLGPSGWNHPDLMTVGGDHLEGAIFTESFFAESRIPFVSQFRTRYREAYGEDPEVLAAQAFDAANLVLVQLARGLTDRREVREGLLAVRAYPGVSGITTILSDGNARKRPFLLQVNEGHIVSID